MNMVNLLDAIVDKYCLKAYIFKIWKPLWMRKSKVFAQLTFARSRGKKLSKIAKHQNFS